MNTKKTINKNYLSVSAINSMKAEQLHLIQLCFLETLFLTINVGI